MLRTGYYCKYKGKVFICGFKDSIVLLRSNDHDDVLSRDFVNNSYYGRKPLNWQTKYRKDVPQEEIEWFCKICTKGKYKGEDVNIDGEENGKYLISSNLILAKDRGVFNEEHGFKDVMDGGYGTYVYAGYVDKSEVTDVKEVKTPINEYLKAPDNWDF